jgi:hypothetical protein
VVQALQVQAIKMKALGLEEDLEELHEYQYGDQQLQVQENMPILQLEEVEEEVNPREIVTTVVQVLVVGSITPLI